MELHTQEQALEKTRHQFSFTGTAREYFGIWIINLVLTILTLGIYSAWAKVRTNRYFYGNTTVAGSAFDYTAEPKKILLGRVIAVSLLIAYQVCIRFFPDIAQLLLVGLILVLPLIYISSIAFRMRYSSWRGINFSFVRNLPGAYLLFSPLMLYVLLVSLGPLFFGLGPEDLAPPEGEPIEDSPALQNYFLFAALIGLAGILLFPLWQRFYYNFIGNHVGFGKSRFQLNLGVGKFYRLYVAAFSMVLLGMIIVGIVIALALALGSETSEADNSFLVMFALLYLAILFAYIISFALVQTRLTNLIYSGITLDDLEFESTLRLGKMIMLYGSNSIAIVLTLGLAIPWAKVRVARYRAENMYLIATDLDNFKAQSADEIDARADAMSDLFDLDIGL